MDQKSASDPITPEEISYVLGQFKTIKMASMPTELEQAAKQGKYCLIVDKNKNAHTYYTYQAVMYDVFRDSMKIRLKAMS